jgi:CRISPR/Cas system-associated exonuclease Cas4 (RecB family)
MNKTDKLYILPTNRAIKEQIAIISQNISSIVLPKYLSIDEFFKRVIITDNKTFIDEDTRVVLLKQASKDIDIQSLGINSDFFSFIKQSSSILKFFEELSLEDITIDDIDTADTYASYEEHLMILKALQHNYLKLLEANNYIDKITLPQSYILNDDFLLEFDSINFIIEGYLSKYEFDMLNKISNITKTIITIHTNQFNPKLIKQFETLNINLNLNYLYEIDLSSKEIIKSTKISQNTKFDIKSFSNRLYQIAFVKSKIYEYINQGIEAKDIALILPDEQFAHYLHLFDTERYFNFAMGFSFKNSRLYTALESIYLYFNSDLTKDIKRLEFLEIEEFLPNIKELRPKANVDYESFNQIANLAINYDNNLDIIQKYKEELFKFNIFLEKIEFEITLNQALGLFIKRVAKLSSDDSRGGKVTVMGLLETRAIQYKAIIIVDFNEDFIPKRSPKDKYISSQIKHNANLPTPQDRESIQKYFFKRVIQNSSHCAISYTNNSASIVSRYLSQLGFNTNDENKNYDEVYQNILFQNRDFSFTPKEIVLDIDLSKQSWSATRLKSYLTCKRQYYYKYILKLNSHSISLKPLGFEFGNAVHNALHKVLSSKPLDANSSTTIKKALFEELNNKNPFLNYERELFGDKIDKFVQFELKRAEEGYTIFALEKEYFAKLNGININGKIDRIDKIGSNYVILDYKTSSSLKVDTQRSYPNSTDFQLEFYHILLQQNMDTNHSIDFVAYYDLKKTKILIEDMLEEKLELLSSIFDELKTSKVDFELCDKITNCQFCDFKTLCSR